MRNIRSLSLLRADEGPRLPGRRSRRAAERHARRHGTRRTSSSSMPWACARTTRRPPSRWTASRPCRSTRSWTWSRPGRPTPTSSPRWPPGWPGWTGNSTDDQQSSHRQGSRRQDARRRSCGDLLHEHRPRRQSRSRPSRSSACPRARSRPRSSSSRSSRSRCAAALKPFHDPKLREAILDVPSGRWSRSSTSRRRTSCCGPGSTPRRWRRPRSLVTSFRQFIEDNKDEIEALQVLYSRRTGPGCGTGR